jgi:hypothetical protein
MKQNKDQCPDCGAFYTVRYSDDSYECFACRRITHPSGCDEEPDYEMVYDINFPCLLDRGIAKDLER